MCAGNNSNTAPQFNTYGSNFPYGNLAAQYNAGPGNLPPSQQFSNASQYGRWNGINNNGMGLLPYSWGSVFGTPGPSPMQFQPPWANNGGYGSNQGPGANPGNLPTQGQINQNLATSAANVGSAYPNTLAQPNTASAMPNWVMNPPTAGAAPAPSLPPQQNPGSEYYGLGGLSGQNLNDMLVYRAMGGGGAFNPIYQRLNSALGGSMPNYTNMYGANGPGYAPGVGQLQYSPTGAITGVGGMAPEAFSQYLPYFQQAGLNVASGTPSRITPPIGRRNP